MAISRTRNCIAFISNFKLINFCNEIGEIPITEFESYILKLASLGGTYVENKGIVDYVNIFYAFPFTNGT